MSKEISQTISNLLLKQKWPGINAITRGDGTMTLLEVELFDDRKYFVAPIIDGAIQSYLNYNEEWLSSFDIFATIQYSKYKVSVGDGSSEENGIVFVVNVEDSSLVWFAFFELSEPFKSVAVDENGCIHARSAIGVTWKMPIEDPFKIEVDHHDPSDWRYP